MPAPHRFRRAFVPIACLLVAASALAVAPRPAGAERSSSTGAAPLCPAAEGNPRFVRFVYLQILNRCPDPGGAAYWTARLDAGLGRWSFAEAIDVSDENLVRNNVNPLFGFLLGRPPTADERARWVAHLRTAHENAVPTASLLAGDEGYARNAPTGTKAERDEAWLEWAYARIMDRAPDPSGQAFYLGWFGADGSSREERYRVAMSLERSTSNARSWVRASMAEALGRPADPSGEAYWMSWLTGRGRWQTFRLWTHQLASDEAYRRAQAQP